MKLLLLFTLFLILPPEKTISASFDESRYLQVQYEDFRQQVDADGHSAITNDKDLAEAFLVYGQKALAAGDAETAINYFRSGRELVSDDGRFSTMLGLAYSRLADNPMAEMYFLEAIRLLEDVREPRQMLVDHYYRAGNLSEAEAQLIELRQLFPNDNDIDQQLKKIHNELKIEAGMVSDVNSIFSVKFDEQIHLSLADQVVEILQDAYAEQGSLLDHYPQQTIQVILYTRNDYDMTTGAPPWSAGRFDGKIRLPVGMHRVDLVDLRRILFHEYNHFLAQQLSRGKAPAWFYEGIAMTAEPSTPTTFHHLSSAKKEGALLEFSSLEKSFGQLEHATALLAYEQSYSFVNYLQQQFGWHTLRDLLLAFGKGLPTEKAFASVFSNFGLDYQQLQVEWLTR